VYSFGEKKMNWSFFGSVNDGQTQITLAAIEPTEKERKK
jgi:hypothetical protein